MFLSVQEISKKEDVNGPDSKYRQLIYEFYEFPKRKWNTVPNSYLNHVYQP